MKGEYGSVCNSNATLIQLSSSFSIQYLITIFPSAFIDLQNFTSYIMVPVNKCLPILSCIWLYRLFVIICLVISISCNDIHYLYKILPFTLTDFILTFSHVYKASYGI